MEKQTQKQIDASKFLNLSNKINGLKRIEGIFPKDLPAQWFDYDKLKEITQLQDIIKLNEVDYKANSAKKYNFSKYLVPIIFLRGRHKRNLTLKDADKE